MIIKHKLKMELTGKETTPYVEVMQYDQLSRILEITMMENGLPALLPENCRTMVRFWKPDGEEGIYDAMPDGRSAWYIKGNTVGIYLVPEVCTAAGTVKIVLQLLDGETLLYSFPVDVLVKENPKIKQRSRSYHHVTGFLPHPEKPRIGEFIRVVEVDEHGHVIRTETAEAMSGEGITREELEKAIDDYIEENGLAECIPGENGKSAYEIAVSQGFEGTQQEWLTSLKGEKGDPGDPGQPGTQGKDGKSAYAYAQDAGFTGTEETFAKKLASETTRIHIGPDAPTNENINVWIDPDEEPEAAPAGKDGKSAYEYAKEGGYTGTEADFAAKLAEEYPTPDWNAAEGQPGHVLNRTHYSEQVELINGSAVYNADMDMFILESEIHFTEGLTYYVTYNGVDYICVSVYFAALGMTAIGNLSTAGMADTGEPFVIMTQDGMTAIKDFNGATEATVRIVEEQITLLPEKYLPASVKPYVITLTKDDTTVLTGEITIERINYDEFAEHAWNGGAVLVDYSAIIGESARRIFPSEYVYYDGIFAMLVAGSYEFALLFPNGTWTPPGYIG